MIKIGKKLNNIWEKHKNFWMFEVLVDYYDSPRETQK
jgi:hypothetical protein